jgi:beta-carotene 3-hydroxylase
MEFVARFLHKYVMHGQGWCLHYDHHNHRGTLFQKNDLYFVIFAALSAALFFVGFRTGWYEIAAMGGGVAIYGVGYVLFHDIMFHGRIRGLKFKPRHPYLKRIINAHRVHHATVTRGGAVSFSFLWAPKFYNDDNKEAINAQLREIRDMQRAVKDRGGLRGTEPAPPSE